MEIYKDKMEDQIILLLCHQINKVMSIIILNMVYFGYIIGSSQKIIMKIVI